MKATRLDPLIELIVDDDSGALQSLTGALLLHWRVFAGARPRYRAVQTERA